MGYFVFDYFDAKRIKDEREELIRLKTFELVGKTTTATVTVLALVYAFYPRMDAFIPLLSLIAASMYSEILGKIFYRRRI